MPARNLTQTQIESVMLDAAIVFINYGETDQAELGITKGGVEFGVVESVRDIEYDGRRGKTKGMVVVDGVDAYVKFSTLEISNANLLSTLGAASETTGKISNTIGGVIAAGHFYKNLTVFGLMNKSTTKYKKIVIKNPAAYGGFTLGTTDKGEATVNLQYNAHWDPTSVATAIYEISDDTTGPTT